MNNRNQILKAVANGKPAPKPLPLPDWSSIAPPPDLLVSFEQFVQAVGGEVLFLDNTEVLQQLISTEKAGGGFIINRAEEGGVVDEVPDSPRLLESVKIAYIRGSIGVAENGAIWVDESAMGNRILPFICEQLVLVLRENELVADMHEAYRRVQINREGFGVFIAGPSKTADIEQSLVIGAHGPKALTVVLLPAL